jgi:putative phosphoribosyl transferase
MVFENRRQAGKLLADRLSEYANRADVLVLAIPRGGVIVGAELASKLEVDLDVIVTKKIGAPDNPELAIGAVAEDGEAIFDEKLVARLGIDQEYKIGKARQVKREKIKDYIDKFRGGRVLEVGGKTVILTDDGVATGATAEAALIWLKSRSVKEIVLAIPTGARDSMERLEKMADIRRATLCF